MPAFEFSIPQGIMFLPANLSFISFCFFISFIIFKLFRSKLIFFISVFSLLSFAYGDIFLKFAIKQYYEKVRYEKGVFSSAQKNEVGKIDSLSTIRAYKQAFTLSNLSLKQKEYLVDIHENYIEKFVDISLYTYKFNKYKYFKQRFYLNVYKYDDSFIEDKNEKARYEINMKEQKSLLSSIYKPYTYSFIDTKSNQIIASAFYIKFENSLNKFRNRFLYWDKQKEELISFSSIENFDYIYKKVFIDEEGF